MNGNHCLEHLLRLAQNGKLRDASEAEQQARRIVLCVLDNAVGLDACATAGIPVLVDCVQLSPQDGREAVREAIR